MNIVSSLSISIVSRVSSSPVKMFLSSRQAGCSNRQQRQPRPEYESDKCEVSSRYFLVGGQMACCRHILTGLI